MISDFRLRISTKKKEIFEVLNFEQLKYQGKFEI
jgi:hypothetical protein